MRRLRVCLGLSSITRVNSRSNIPNIHLIKSKINFRIYWIRIWRNTLAILCLKRKIDKYRDNFNWQKKVIFQSKNWLMIFFKTMHRIKKIMKGISKTSKIILKKIRVFKMNNLNLISLGKVRRYMQIKSPSKSNNK